MNPVADLVRPHHDASEHRKSERAQITGRIVDLERRIGEMSRALLSLKAQHKAAKFQLDSLTPRERTTTSRPVGGNFQE
jgi:hypothetical protein